jgi:hypothetical protein
MFPCLTTELEPTTMVLFILPVSKNLGFLSLLCTELLAVTISIQINYEDSLKYSSRFSKSHFNKVGEFTRPNRDNISRLKLAGADVVSNRQPVYIQEPRNHALWNLLLQILPDEIIFPGEFRDSGEFPFGTA